MSYLRFITNQYDVFTEKIPCVMSYHGQLRATYWYFTSFFFFTDCYEYITECYYSSKLILVSYDLFPCCYITNSYELVTNIYESYDFLPKII